MELDGHQMGCDCGYIQGHPFAGFGVESEVWYLKSIQKCHVKVITTLTVPCDHWVYVGYHASYNIGEKDEKIDGLRTLTPLLM